MSDDFLHCTDASLEQERINITFHWIKQHTISCALRTGVVCCLPTCVRAVHLLLLRRVLGVAFFGHSGCSLESCAYGRCWLCWFFPSCLQRANRWTRPVGGGRWRHCLRNPRGVHCFAQKSASDDHGIGSNSIFQCCMCLP